MRLRFLLGLLVGVVIVCAGGVAASAQTEITSSLLNRIEIQPNDRPTVVDIGADQQFVATGYTAEGAEIENITFTWSTTGDIGTVTNGGLFTATQGGVGTVTATSGDVFSTIGVVGHATEENAPPTNDEQAAENTTTNEEETTELIPSSSVTVEDVVTDEEVTASDNGDGQLAEAAATEDAMMEATNETTTEECTTIRSWIWVIIVLVYVVLLFIYFLALGDSTTAWWWFWPAVLTAALLVLYFQIGCPGYQVWVPWVLVILGLLLAIFYIRVLRPKKYDHVPPPQQQGTN